MGNYETVAELTVTSAMTDSEYALVFRFIAHAIEAMELGDALRLSLERHVDLDGGS